MFNLARDNDSICAISTPQGVGAISIVRLSGWEAIEIARRLANFLPVAPECHRVYYGILRSPESNEELDEVLVAFFSAGKSFSGEDTIEISCHGSPAIAQLILQNLVLAGARPAQPGEFTYRAFSRGRIDLTQAESVLLMVESHSKQAAQLALRQLRGSLTREIQKLEHDLLWCLSRLEANIDFSSEDLVFSTHAEIGARVDDIIQQVKKLISSYRAGRIAKDGLRVVLIGAPNVGKSSILNRLAGESRAIVSSIAGTTRDTVEVTVDLNGQKVELVDTAGLHDSEDELEKLGMQRSQGAIQTADLIFHIQDTNSESPPKIFALLKTCSAPIVSLRNKIDLLPSFKIDETEIACSAQSGVGIERITEIISQAQCKNDGDSTPALMVSRHFDLLRKAEENLNRCAELIKSEASHEFCISDLNEALMNIMEISGRRYDDQVLDQVFRDFCLGK